MKGKDYELTIRELEEKIGYLEAQIERYKENSDDWWKMMYYHLLETREMEP